MELRTSVQDLNTLTVTLSLVFFWQGCSLKNTQKRQNLTYIYIYTKYNYQVNVVQLITLGQLQLGRSLAMFPPCLQLYSTQYILVLFHVGHYIIHILTLPSSIVLLEVTDFYSQGTVYVLFFDLTCFHAVFIGTEGRRIN